VSAASHAALALLGVAAGAGLAWTADHRTALDTVTTHGEWVYFKATGTADSVRAYVAYPERKDKAPAVNVIHELFGLGDWEPTVVDRLAKNSYVAVVPDLLSSKFG
jgi:carboxymethylenebutenolidase